MSHHKIGHNNMPNERVRPARIPEIVTALDYDFIIFGGAFNPVHIGHRAIIQTVLEKSTHLQKLFLVPTHRPAHKAALELSASERLGALQAAIGGFSTTDRTKIEIIDFELRRAEISYSLHTIEHLQSLHPKATKWGFVLGLDALQILPKWFQIERVVELVDFVTFPRAHPDTAATTTSDLLEALRGIYQKLSGRVRLVGLAEPIPEASSTAIRSLLKEWTETKTRKTSINLDISELEAALRKDLTPAVFEYFKNKT